jgi:YihY family inner membrane protein
VTQAEHTGFTHRYLALTVGLVGTLITATTAMGQLERGLNRLYGVEQDRPTMQKYGHAFRLAVTAGALGTLAFALVAFGSEIDSNGSSTANDIWRVVSWPLAVLAITVAVTLLFRSCPRRRQPARSWLAFGAGVAVVLWFIVTFALGAFFRFSSSFGDTYGPLAGIVALQLWALFSAVVVFYGGAVAAQLEAVRAGRPVPQDLEKVAESEPEHLAAAPG